MSAESPALPESFFEAMVVSEGRRIVFYSPALLDTVVLEMADFADRLAVDGPLVFSAGDAPADEDDGHGGPGGRLAVRLNENDMEVTTSTTTSVAGWDWPSGDRLFLVFAGGAGGGVFASRRFRSPTDGVVRTGAHWSYEASFARTASLWVGERMGVVAPDIARRWLERCSTLSEISDRSSSAGRRRRPSSGA